MEPTDEQLVLKAQRGERQAFEELFSRYKDKAYSIAWHMCSGMDEEAEDATQEAFLRAFNNIHRFRRDSDFYTWFYRILVNTCLDGRRKRWRWSRLFAFSLSDSSRESPSAESQEETEFGAPDNPLDNLSRRRFLEDLDKALKALPHKQRAVFQLKVLNGLKIREISQIMEMAEGTVKSHLFRAIKSLQRALGDWDQGIVS
jgi:RNA polymerase sigma-70 factor (ECF subfamily)